jgi:hypothetical protein
MANENQTAFSEGNIRMKKANALLDPIRIGFGIALLAILNGCVGYVDGGYGGAVVVAPVPNVVVFDSGYERGPVVHSYSQRGVASRAVAHPGSVKYGGRP